VAAASEWVHVVERPHDGLVRGLEERKRVNKAIDPM